MAQNILIHLRKDDELMNEHILPFVHYYVVEKVKENFKWYYENNDIGFENFTLNVNYNLYELKIKLRGTAIYIGQDIITCLRKEQVFSNYIVGLDCY